ncbi:MAG: hypothetical protein ACSNEK_08600 [Parachlamydiaceae bacterium]
MNSEKIDISFVRRLIASQFLEGTCDQSCKIDSVAAALKIWKGALRTPWVKQPVWIHGDISLGNLLLDADR